MADDYIFDSKNESDNNDNNEEKIPESVITSGSITTHSSHGTIQCLTIIGQIEGHTTQSSETKTTKYEHVIPQLAAIEESPELDGLLILINTVGGDVEAGLALAELIASMKTPTVSIVLGGGHSIGVPLAVAAQRSFIVPSATMTIHPVRFNGTVIGAPQTYHYFEKMQERIVRFVTDHSNISEENFRSFLLETDELASDVGSVVTGDEAVESGLIDELGGLSDALDCLHRMIDERKKANMDDENCNNKCDRESKKAE